MNTRAETAKPIRLNSYTIRHLERRVIDAAMARLKQWHEQEPEGLLPADHERGIKNGPARDLIVACLALEAMLNSTDATDNE